MRHRKKGFTLDRKKGPRELLLGNLASSLIMYEKIVTTNAKAKATQSLVERLITLSKPKTISARRQAAKFLPVKKAQAKLFEVLSVKYQNFSGGYTRIVKTGPRKGDGASLVRIELI